MTSQSQLEAVTIPRELYDFLMGTGEIDGASFGDLQKGLPGRFWWRALLQTAARSTPAASDGLREARNDYAIKDLPLLLRDQIVTVLRCEAEPHVIDDACRIVEQAADAIEGKTKGMSREMGESIADRPEIIALLPAGVEGEAECLRAHIAHLESRLAAVDVLVGDGFWNSVHEAFDRAGAPRKSDDGGIVYGIIDRINQFAALNAPDRARGRLEGLEEAAKVADAEEVAASRRVDEKPMDSDWREDSAAMTCAVRIAAAIRALSVPVRGEG